MRGARLASLAPEQFGQRRSFVAQLREQSAGAAVNAHPSSDRSSAFSRRNAPGVWAVSEAGCLESLRAFCLGQDLCRGAAESPPIAPFLEALAAHRGQPALLFRFLVERYECPLNIAADAEQEIRERLLLRLMTSDRVRLEKNTPEGDESDELLLKLNLVAIYAARADDLRYLDALNYYYEVLPAEWIPSGREPWLLPAYLGLYARALAAWVKENRRCV